MKTPKEYAEELVNKMYLVEGNTGNCILDKQSAKQCALIAVEEIIKQWDYIDTYLADYGGKLNPNLKYFLEVKQELEKI